ncbi:MAG: preprotein translocase subunit SecY [Candidatus Doudnabacteria bacterium RIFCSPLOWO2_02_FULL_42_9]|uniref:Protein translocase subunit SecY n=1 Tax=Candidatus Doudnabacteria bacterium RIFCSPHIGHO2_01_FULL_41_86 TaxID=1817821 RepID=A0A1F5N9I1_9BACT|nr:MAG: preprotein translocase subunit SecY [Candidatus Doudnabacteria bacterium RIFCSPHIGHO2_01_FULL_41_86]OGE75026.1 MAG: preprotein translocase subunit SecY [Candidatus Doudnabacteria bacterium RIFCSPHIGHO2_01_43_10]OGE85267.1 MAG: preprotein translocase subunit SecY [Candidatus Doudnabacteria bacterium RIFCSPHIGHO2_12_FULL_42_22]OGE86805.1 MAG: preprotein translocase subunit SecY [Candidatus Doudnabacteria bacterium RIFCSPHIGHO2_02_FULL_42_25]OGE92404.1 MAG: preprotein translocase subunit S
MSRISQIWKVKELRNKIIIVGLLLLVTRILAHIPIPGIELANLRSLLSENTLLGLFDIFSGGGLRNFSIVMLGVGPYITASIIMQLLTVIIPKLGELQKEGGEAGRAKINQYMRYLTVPLTAIQGYGTIVLLSRSTQVGIGDFTSFEWFIILLSITAGTMILLWIGEMISEFKIGNGISLIIFAGIVAGLPTAAQQAYVSLTSSGNTITGQNLVTLISYLAVALVVIGGVVLITEAQRNIPVSYAKRVRGNKMYGGVNTHLPLRVNQAGVIPIIFAISILLFPGLIANFFSHAKTEAVANAATAINNFFQNQTYQAIIYFILVVAFTYFYTAIVFNPDEISDNIQKQGGFVPGLRPGRQTADFLYKVLNRITLVGALFLGLIAVLPNIIQGFTHTQALTLGGTSLLIAVSVVIEVMKQVQAQMVMRDYEDF